MIAEVVAELDASNMVDGMRKMEAYLQAEVLPRYRAILP
jgi:hypothetical protein